MSPTELAVVRRPVMYQPTQLVGRKNTRGSTILRLSGHQHRRESSRRELFISSATDYLGVHHARTPGWKRKGPRIPNSTPRNRRESNQCVERLYRNRTGWSA